MISEKAAKEILLKIIARIGKNSTIEILKDLSEIPANKSFKDSVQRMLLLLSDKGSDHE
jgi:hypothetical protein